MAEFSGPLTLRLVGAVQGVRPGTFDAELRATTSLLGMRLDAYGMLSGLAEIQGFLTLAFTDLGGSTTSTTRYYVWTMPVFEPVETFDLAVGGIGDLLGFAAWSGGSAFGPGHVSLSLDGGGSFDTGMVDGERIFGTATTSGRIALIGTHYSVAPLEPVVLEGDSGITPVTFRVARVSADGAPSTVYWLVHGDRGFDRLADGTAATGQIAFAQDQTEALVTFGVRGDITYDIDWMLRLNLTEAPPGFYGLSEESLFSTRSLAVVTILNDDVQRQVGIVAVDADKPEGDSGVTPFVFRVFRSGGDIALPLSVTVRVTNEYWTHPHTANFEDSDGGFDDHVLTIPEGQASILFTVPIAGDTLAEPSESFVVDIWQHGGNADEVDIVHRQAVGRIRADDAHREDWLSVSLGGSGAAVAAVARFYDGPVFGPVSEYVRITAENLNIAVRSAGWFIHTGSGNDAIRAAGGSNVLDGGSGSNFLTGGGSQDSFFVDLRGLAAPVWSTVEGFGYGSSVTIWGLNEDDFAIAWFDGLGAPGYEGLTLVATAADRPAAALTIRWYTVAAMADGKVWAYFGHDPASDSDFMRMVMT